MGHAASGPSLLQSIRARPNNFKRNLPLTPRQVENAKDSTTTSNNQEHPQRESNIETAGDVAPPAAAQVLEQPAKKLKSMTSKSFYKVDTLRMDHVEERVLRFLARLRDRAKAGGHVATLWRQFPTQQAAFDFADQNDPSGEYLRTFSVELASTGTRRFLVTSLVEFWRRYEAMVPHNRHYYEIIRQGWPCHLYLDLEYSIPDNPEKDGQAAVDALLSLLREEAHSRLSIHLEDSGILELDSSTDTKFSRHLIIRFPGAAFATNIHAGAFIQGLCKRAQEEREEDPRFGSLFVSKGDISDACFIDLGVYTRNRAFRLHLSSKAGKTARLMPTGRYGTSGLRPERVFMDSLVCNVAPEARLIRCFDDSGDTAAAPTAKTARASARARQAIPSHGGNTAGDIYGAASTILGPSPYPDIDKFIESVCSHIEGPPGSIRSWVSLDDGAVLLYNIKGNRFCGNIGRQHQSNGVFYVVDLQQGVWYQKCYDPECRWYRSPVTALPEELVKLPVKAHQSGALEDEEKSENEDAKEGAEERGNGKVESELGRTESEVLLWGHESDAEEWEEAALAAIAAAEATAFL